MTIEEAQKLFPEVKQRKQLYDSIDALKATYEAILNEDIDQKIRQQMILK